MKNESSETGDYDLFQEDHAGLDENHVIALLTLYATSGYVMRCIVQKFLHAPEAFTVGTKVLYMQLKHLLLGRKVFYIHLKHLILGTKILYTSVARIR